MPRASYYSGPIAGGAQAYAAPAKPSLMQSLLGGSTALMLGEGIGGMVAKRFQDPTTDPEAQLARQRAAEAALNEDKLNQAKAARKAAAEFGDVTSAYTRELPERIGTDPLTAQQQSAIARVLSGAYQGAVAAGGDPEQLTPLMQAFWLQFTQGDFGDNMTVRTNASGLGGDPAYIKDNESPSLVAQTMMRDDIQAADQAKQDSINTTDIAMNERRAQASEYGSRQSAGASIEGARISAGASERNNQRDNQTSRYQTVYDSVFGGIMDSAPRTQSTTTSVTDADGKPKGSRTETKTSGLAPTGRASQGSATRGAPAAASDPFPGIAEGEIVVQGGQRYQRRGSQMVPVT